MRILILGVSRQSGIGKDSKKPYELAPVAHVATPLEQVDRERFRKVGSGYEPAAIECSLEVFQLLATSLREPAFMEVEVTPRKRGDGFQPVISAIKSPQAKAS